MTSLHTRLHLSVISALIFLAVPSSALAASLNFSSANASVGQGTTITENVLVASADQSMNAVSGTISFPANLLQVVSVSKANSVLTLWVQEPTFSNDTGEITFSGIVPNPGYTGGQRQVLSVQFRAVTSGTATVTFTSASEVLANDGSGTNILTSTPPATITVTNAAPTPTPTPTPVPSGNVVITSSTHPDQSKWYKATAVELAWHNPAQATNVRIGYDKFPQGSPSVVYNPLISNKSLTLAEGVWYFHVQEEDANGWGATKTFRIQIDLTPPNPIHIQFPHGASSNDPQPLAIFNTTDDLSGVSYYTLALGSSSPVEVPSASVTSSPYPLPVTGPGPGTVVVTAYDKAGNSVSDQASFTVNGLNSPKINAIQDITVGQALQISGTTYPNAQVEILLKDSGGNKSSQTSQADLNGTFKIFWKDPLSVGTYSVTAQATDSTGVKSTFSAEVIFQVRAPSVLSANYLYLFLFLLFILSALFVVIRYVSRRFSYTHRQNNSKLGHTHALLHQQFTELKYAIVEEIASLEKIAAKRDLTIEETRFIHRFQKMLDKAEGIIEEEVDRVAK